MNSQFKEQLEEEHKEYEAVKETHNMDERRSLTDHDHRFTLLGREAECNCGWGLYLQPGDDVRDGHIYAGDKLIV